MTFRMPLISRPAQGANPDSLMARTFVSAGLALLTAVALPNGEIAHATGMDAGRPRVRYVDKSWVKQTDLPLLTFVQQPNGNAAGLELPKILLRNGYRDKSWIETNDLPRRLASYPPYQPTDWPLAKKPLPSAWDQQLQNVAALNTVVAITKPFLQTEWAFPKKPLLDLPDTTEGLSLPLVTFVQQPFHLTDWPLPSRALLDVPDWSGPNIAAIRTIIVATQPFSLFDWPLPPKRLLDLPDTSGTLSLALTAQPFNLTDWPLPHKRLLDLPDTTANLSLSLTAKPFLNTDWPLSVRPKAATPEPETLNVAAIRTVVAATKPFAQLDWNLPKIFRDNRQARVTPLRDGTLFDVTPVVTYNLVTTDTPDTAFFSLAFWRPKPVNQDIWTPIPVNRSSLGSVLTESSLDVDTELGIPLLLNSITTTPLFTESVLEIDTESGVSILATADDPGGTDLLWTPIPAGSSIWRKV